MILAVRLQILCTIGGVFAVLLTCSFYIYNYERLSYIHSMDTMMVRQIDTSNLQSETKSVLDVDVYLSEHNKRLKFYKLWKDDNQSLPMIYIITPTYARMEQKADLTRLSNTLLHIRSLHWVVVEDSIVETSLVTNLLLNCGIKFTHLKSLTPEMYKLKPGEPRWHRPRGVIQRNAGLRWIRTTLDSHKHKGVLYFADDDNAYSLDLFDQMRGTKKVSVWPVGLAGGLRYIGPIVYNKKVIGWNKYWNHKKFEMDMAGFAINLEIIFHHSNAVFYYTSSHGHQETEFLENLGVKLMDLEPKADNCTKVLVWHTRTQEPSLQQEKYMLENFGKQTDINIEI